MESKVLHRFALSFAGACVMLAAVNGQPPSPAPDPPARPRARDLGVSPGVFPPGPLNAITDVAGVRVGHVTLVEGDGVRTGVTAIVPHGGNLFQDKVAGAVFVGNAFGKLAGSTQVTELGTIETPIVLTNTLSVGTVVDALARYTIAQPGNERVQSVNPLVGETNDGGLNDIRGLHVTRDHVVAAVAGAAAGPVAEGSVGAGTGTQCYGWKGGIGTASRVLPARYGGFTLGVLVQSNFGGVLTIGGAPVGRELGRYAYGPARPGGDDPAASADGSCMIVVATDAPIDARDLRRLAARAVFGLARTGSSYSNGSGDFAVAFTTAADLRTRFGESQPRARSLLPSDGVSPLFQAVLEATEEAVYNSLLRATSVTSRQRTVEAIPVDRVREILKKYNVGQ
jgi:D-aminopeptidase